MRPLLGHVLAARDVHADTVPERGNVVPVHVGADEVALKESVLVLETEVTVKPKSDSDELASDQVAGVGAGAAERAAADRDLAGEGSSTAIPISLLLLPASSFVPETSVPM